MSTPISASASASAPLAPIVVFDLDGTLAETADDLVATLNAVLAREGLPPVDVGEARGMIGAGARALIQRGFAAVGQELAPARLDALFTVFLAHYAEHLCEASHLFPGVTGALVRLADAGYRLAVCTNKVEAHSVALLTALGVAGRFSAICGRDTGGRRPEARGDGWGLAHRHRHRQGGRHPRRGGALRLHGRAGRDLRARRGHRALRRVVGGGGADGGRDRD
jgi:phosphoserine phosphatase